MPKIAHLDVVRRFLPPTRLWPTFGGFQAASSKSWSDSVFEISTGHPGPKGAFGSQRALRATLALAKQTSILKTQLGLLRYISELVLWALLWTMPSSPSFSRWTTLGPCLAWCQGSLECFESCQLSSRSFMPLVRFVQVQVRARSM